MNINSYIKLFFTQKDCRWTIFKIIREKILSMPIVISIQAWIMVLRNEKKYKGLSKWERYLKEQEFIYNMNEYAFMCKILILKMYMESLERPTMDEFVHAKEEILSDIFINEERFNDLKKWLEKIDSNETDCSKLQYVIDEYTRKLKE